MVNEVITEEVSPEEEIQSILGELLAEPPEAVSTEESEVTHEEEVTEEELSISPFKTISFSSCII